MRTESALRKNKSLRASIPYKQAQSLGILFSVEDKQKHLEIKDFIQRLEQDGKKVHVLEFLPKKKENYEFMFDFFTEKDLSFWGNLNSDKALRFSEMPLISFFMLTKNPILLFWTYWRAVRHAVALGAIMKLKVNSLN